MPESLKAFHQTGPVPPQRGFDARWRRAAFASMKNAAAPIGTRTLLPYFASFGTTKQYTRSSFDFTQAGVV